MLHLDKETRSRTNLITDGGYNYATCPSTQVTLTAFAFDDDEPEIFIDPKNVLNPKIAAQVIQRLKDMDVIVHTIYPESIKHYIRDGGMIAAHNAQFERLMMWYYMCPEYDIPEPTIEQFYCTATQARLNNMPGHLEDCAKALGVDQLKDKEGKDLIKLLCIPRGEDDTFNEDVDLYVKFALYCLQDVRAERAISKAMRPMTDRELDDYLVNELINDRGLLIDRPLAAAAVEYATDEQADLIAEIQLCTDGAVKKARGKTLLEWVYNRLDEPQQKHMHKYKAGEKKKTLDRTARERLLNDPDTPIHVRQVVEASDFAQASSTGKFQAMVNRADPDTDRVHGAFIFSGAGSTQRYSSKGVQAHNMPRDKLKDPEQIRKYILDNMDPDVLVARSGFNIMQTLKRLLRHSIKAAPGKEFVCGDWGQIEGRVMPWLAMGVNAQCDTWAQDKLDQYANQTEEYDVYCQAAESVYRQDVRRDGSELAEQQRQIGKVAELSLQFGGGEGAFMGMATGYGVHVEFDEATVIKGAWRGANPWAPVYWKALHSAAVRAVRAPMTQQYAGRVTYMYQPSIMHGTLWCLLPSGTVLAYPAARVEVEQTRYGSSFRLSAMKAAWKPKADEKEWPRITLWHGVLAENVTQAVSAVLLRDTLADLSFEHDAPIVGDTHDEILLEVESKRQKYWHKRLQKSMLKGQKWSKGLPLAVDIWTGPNFRK